MDNEAGEQIGHIKREQALHLSPLLDRGELLIEGKGGGHGLGSVGLKEEEVLLCASTPAVWVQRGIRIRCHNLLATTFPPHLLHTHPHT